MRGFGAIILAVMFCALSGAAHADKRIALVIGNSIYRNVPSLPNPSNDAGSMAELFRSAGFSRVDLRRDLTVAELRRAISDFAELAGDADVAVVYFAGHGIEIDGVNYIIPVDARLARDFDIEDETVSVDRVLKSIEPAQKLRLVILDACRDNPFLKTMKRSMASRSVGRGLAKVEPAASDTLIAFAARAGSVALDGDAKNSPFTSALLHNLATPGLDLRIAFGKVRDEVLKATGRAQEPFVYGSLGGSVITLVDAPKTLPPPPPPPVDEIVWNAVKDAGHAAVFDEFVSKFPLSRHLKEAEARRDDLRKQAAATAAPPPPPASEIVWNAIRGSRTAATFEEYLGKFPDGTHRDEARARLDQLKEDELRQDEARQKQLAALAPAPPPRDAAAAGGAIDLKLKVLDEAAEAALKPKATFRECDKCPEMVVVPPGSFMMGSPDNEAHREAVEGPQHRVSFEHRFAAGRFAVTFEEWDACVADGGCNGYRPWDNGWGRGRRPVVSVSWQDAKNYVAWLSLRTGRAYRLPSEAEREYLARAGTTTPYWWGAAVTRRNANYDERSAKDRPANAVSSQKTMPVDSFQPNPWGFFQVSGNVWEWVEDCSNDSYAGASTDGAARQSGNCERRGLRGGSWISEAALLRSAARYAVQADGRVGNVGFRVARDVRE
ncbi:MAG TPA: SUMF1/EgtB/PvdO family nonheme iron enzyme [Bradyrhizobium sp.]|nr:SUMF1/EgtB/PvdO family nonheme iron enzyme [Bradyrhizobium sp.]